MKIELGIVGYSSAWKQSAAQEGLPWRMVNLTQDRSWEECSVIAVSRSLTGLEKVEIQRYLSTGGAILGAAQHLVGVHGIATREENIEFLLSREDSLFPDIGLIDLGVTGHIPLEANTLRTSSNGHALFAGPLGGGHALLLPFDLQEMFFDSRAMTKNFYSSRDRIPSERVSLVAKGEIRYLLHRALQYLHHVRGYPYAHLWYFPNGERTLFALRIDSDKGSHEEITALYALARMEGIGCTWFLDVRSHESWLGWFSAMIGQEIALHCYEHKTYDGKEENLRNIARAGRLLESVGFHPSGFAAPFGMWNPGIAAAVEETGFTYSSEFSYVYDTLPMFPEVEKKESSTLQIPIHPICIGSMLRVGYTPEVMKSYFRGVAQRKFGRGEPLFFYHHPTHGCVDVLKDLSSFCKEKSIRSTTLGEYAAWWNVRSQHRISLFLDGHRIASRLSRRIGSPDPATLSLRISNASGSEAFVPLGKKEIDLLSIDWHRMEEAAPFPEDIGRIREFDPRTLLGNIFTAMSRRLK